MWRTKPLGLDCAPRHGVRLGPVVATTGLTTAERLPPWLHRSIGGINAPEHACSITFVGVIQVKSFRIVSAQKPKSSSIAGVANGSDIELFGPSAQREDGTRNRLGDFCQLIHLGPRSLSFRVATHGNYCETPQPKTQAPTGCVAAGRRCGFPGRRQAAYGIARPDDRRA